MSMSVSNQELQEMEERKAIHSQFLSLCDGCSDCALRLSLLSSLLLAHSSFVPPLGVSKDDFDEEFLCFIMEQLDCLRDTLFELSSSKINE